MNNISLLEKIKETVKSKYKLAEMILYGSRARGDSSTTSDWDILILLQNKISKTRKEELLNILYDLELEYEEVISPIIHSKYDWEKFSGTPLYYQVKHEGRRI